MSSIPSDRNLLVGMLALQLGLISGPQLIEAMQAWVFRKQDLIEDILLEQTALTEQTREFLKSTFEQHLQIFDSDVTKSLATIPYRPEVYDELEKIEDHELSLSLDKTVDSHSLSAATSAWEIEPEKIVPSPKPSSHTRFRILRPHARGGLGKISIAQDTELNREVALKQIQAKHRRSSDSRARFLVEAEVTGRLEHPGIVPVYSLGVGEDGHPFYAMKFIRGISLKEAIDRYYGDKNRQSQSHSRLELRQLIQRLIDVSNTVEYAHSRGVLHRDLKPQNIMLGKYGETLVVDWGLAKAGSRPPELEAADEASVIMSPSGSSSHTRMGSVFGTPGYMSPEQSSGDPAAITALSDVFSLGGILYHILTGQSSLPDPLPEDMMAFLRLGEVVPPQSLNPNAPKDLCAVCMKAMSKDPRDRYITAHAFVEDLNAWLADDPVSARQSSISERLIRFAKRNRTTAAVSATLVVAALLATTLFWLMSRHQNQLLVAARNAAINQRDRADENLESLQSLVVTLIDTCEKELPNIKQVFPVRLKLTDAAAESFDRLYQQNSSAGGLRKEYAHVLRVLSNVNRLNEKFDDAETVLKRSLQIQKTVDTNQLTDEERNYLVESYRELGTLYQAQGKLGAAGQSLQTARELAAQASRNAPGSLANLRTSYSLNLEEALLRASLGNSEQALKLAQNAQQLAKQASQQSSDNTNDRIILAFAYARELRILSDLKQFPKLVERGRQALLDIKELNGSEATNSNITFAQSRVHYLLAEALAEVNPNDPEACPLAQQAVNDLQKIFDVSNHTQHAYSLVSAQVVLGRIYLLGKKFAESQETLSHALKLVQELSSQRPLDANDEILASVYEQFAWLEYVQQHQPQAIEFLDKSIEHQKKVSEQQPENIHVQELLAALKKQKADWTNEKR